MSQHDYDTTLNAVQTAVLTRDGTVAVPLIAGSDALPAHERLQIYLNAYRLRLRGATLVDYPAFAQLVGPDVARKLTDTYVAATPSHSYSLGPYSLAFADFVQGADIPGAAKELAKLEQAIAYAAIGAADAPLLELPADPVAMAARLFTLRASATLLAFAHDVESHYRAYESAPAITQKHTWLCVYRHNGSVQRVALEQYEYELLRALHNGAPLGEALDAIPESATTNVLTWLPRWVALHLLAAN